MKKLIVVALLLSACGVGPTLIHSVPVVGPSGPPGPQGNPGTTITVVQFCQGNTVYPTTFPESGLCIAGQVYAVFDQPNGYDYLTLVPPGQYESEATSLACTFTVKPNCIIVN